MASDIELEVPEGLEFVAREELLARYPGRVLNDPRIKPGALRFQYEGNLGGLLALRTIIAAYSVYHYDVPRPKALLGHQHFARLTEQMQIAMALGGVYKTVRLSAAGSDSSVMQRLKSEIASATRLTLDETAGDLFVRVRRARIGWETLVRLSPRPSATRPWRVENYPGALNAAVAQAMVHLSEPDPDDRVFNAMCGSGTLMIERLLQGPAVVVTGCDTSEDARAAAKANIEAAGIDATHATVEKWDITDLPVDENTYNIVFADLPFGQLSGSHEENERLYPTALSEIARVCYGDLIAITHEVRLMERAIQVTPVWTVRAVHRVTLSGLHPRIFVLTNTE